MKLYAGAFITDWLVGAVPKSDKWNKMRHPHHPEKIHVESQLAQSLCGHCTLISSRPHASMWVDKVLGATVFSSFRATYTFAGQQFIRPGLDGPGSRCWNGGELESRTSLWVATLWNVFCGDRMCINFVKSVARHSRICWIVFCESFLCSYLIEFATEGAGAARNALGKIL